MAKASAVPKGYNTVTTYLIVKDAAGVLSFMKKAFGAKVTERHNNPDGTIMHAQAKIGDTIIMLSDVCKGDNPIPAMLYMYVPNCDAVYKKALKAGGKPLMKPTDMFYGDRSGSVQDKAGNKWWIATHKRTVSRQEIKKQAARQVKKK